MDSKEVVGLLKKMIGEQKANGAITLSLAGMEAALNELERIVIASGTTVPTPLDLERYKADLASHLDHQNRIHEVGLEMMKATITTGLNALKTALLINGGATVAILAFIGKVWAVDSGPKLSAGMVYPLSIFAAGVLVAGLAAAATYMTQAGYGKEFGRFSRRIGVIGHVMAVSFTLGSYGLFGYGIFECAKTLIAGGR